MWDGYSRCSIDGSTQRRALTEERRDGAGKNGERFSQNATWRLGNAVVRAETNGLYPGREAVHPSESKRWSACPITGASVPCGIDCESLGRERDFRECPCVRLWAWGGLIRCARGQGVPQKHLEPHSWLRKGGSGKRMFLLGSVPYRTSEMGIHTYRA